MPGINSGILTNAHPLTTEQIKELEKKASEMQEIFAYLNERGELCFTGPFGPEIIKELAWHKAYELTADDTTLIKHAYEKTGLKDFSRVESYKKQSYEDDYWVAETNFCLADGCAYITSNNLIFCTKEI
jgi:hypothetical protein